MTSSERDLGASRPAPILILASASPRRLALLEQIGIRPDRTLATDIDERARKGEGARALAGRLAGEKEMAARAVAGEGGYVLAADTVVAVGRRILPKPDDREAARRCLALLSGRAHRVFTGVALSGPSGRVRLRTVETRVKFKRLAEAEVAAYLASGEWHGKAGGYAIQGLAAAFVAGVIGSYSGVVGLPLHETAALLDGEGYAVRGRWARADDDGTR